MATAFPPIDGSAPKQQAFGAPPAMGISADKRYVATMETSHGTMVIALDPIRAPRTVNNFVFLALHHFFDGIVFHRVIKNFMLQGGDPLGTGYGGPGYEFEDELPKAGQYEVGSLAMANSGPNTNGSQFFVISGRDGVRLAPQYSLFGKVVKGLEVIDAIQAVPTDRNDRPRQDVTILSVTIAEKD